ncbi:MAG: hypothetical protein ACOCP4_05640 [Candidatus Woesearchaeota archaeon]
MSRSYKKTPGHTDQQRNSKTPKFFKRKANKKVRKFKGELPEGKVYRKLYNPYDICDWKFLAYDEKEIDSWPGNTPKYKHYIK